MKIPRRSWTAGLLGVAFGCWSRPQAPTETEPSYPRVQEPTPIDPVQRVSRRLQIAMSGDGVAFDPFTLSIIASVLCSVIRYCMAQHATRIQRLVRRRPDGAQAVILRGKLTAKYATAQVTTDANVVNLFADPDAVKKHVDATMSAFLTATPEELTGLILDLKASNAPANVTSARAAADWSRIE